jgi:DNA topoisomerase-2
LKNDEIQNIIKIMGLYLASDYSSPSMLSNLRYGSIMIMTDQDHDGSHIKGLIINFLHFFWPKLLKHNGFLKEFITPIIKVTYGSNAMSFFTIADFEKWEREVKPSISQKVHVKYYKGLGTSTGTEAKEYFRSLQKHVIQFRHPSSDAEMK